MTLETFADNPKVQATGEASPGPREPTGARPDQHAGRAPLTQRDEAVVHLFLVDETNRDYVENYFFIVGGLVFRPDQIAAVDAVVATRRAQAGFRPGDSFKFDTKARPQYVDAAQHREAKKDLVADLQKIGVRMIVSVVLDDLAANRQRHRGHPLGLPEELWGGVTKDDIFFYLYGILHSSDYRGQFEGDLKKMLPRIPKSKDFRAFSDAGRKLSALHLNYETVELYPLDDHRGVNASFRVENMKYAKTGRVADKTTVIYNSEITIFGIPEEAHEYMLGSRSAIDWIIERYQVKTDKASGIINDPNDWADGQGNPRYILDLLARIVTVSVETVRIVNALPSLDILDA